MTQAEQGKLAYLQEVRANFTALLREAAYSLPPDNELERLNFGPTYKEVTRKGVPLTIRTFLITPPVDQRIKILDSSFLAVAEDFSGEIVGYRKMEIEKRAQTEGFSLEAGGDIGVAQRGQGIARPLELVTQDMLTAIATERGLPIYWQVENGNLKRLKAAKDALSTSEDPTEQELVSNIEQEQQRWQHLYGENGSLGFNDKGMKIIDPSNNPSHKVPLKKYDTLSLTYSRAQIGDENELRQQKLAYYQEVLKPKIDALLHS